MMKNIKMKKNNKLNTLLNKIEENNKTVKVITSLLKEKNIAGDELKNQVKSILRKVFLARKNTSYVKLSSEDFRALILNTDFTKLTVESYLEMQINLLVDDGKVSIILPKKGWDYFYANIPKEILVCLNITTQSRPAHFGQPLSILEAPSSMYVYVELELLWH